MAVARKIHRQISTKGFMNLNRETEQSVASGVVPINVPKHYRYYRQLTSSRNHSIWGKFQLLFGRFLYVL